jgi:hypothetical protein
VQSHTDFSREIRKSHIEGKARLFRRMFRYPTVQVLTIQMLQSQRLLNFEP